ncbi:MAG TPA: hypothetical protein VIK40_10525 [Geomonas sp.]
MRKLWLFLLAAIRRGCATHSEVNRERLASLPQHYSQFDMALAWEVKPAGKETVVQGVVKNLRYAFMDGIEVWIAAVDAAGKTRARSVCYILSQQIKQDEVAPFSIKLPVLVEPGTLLQFTYKYQGSDGGEGGVNWMQSFESVVPGL